MYQYSRAIYRSIKDMIDPMCDRETQLEYRRAVLAACEQTMERLANDPLYFAKPGPRALPGHPPLLPDHRARRRSPGRCRRASRAAMAFIEEQIEAGAFDGGVARCRATTRKGKPCQRTPLPERDYCPSHQHLERRRSRPRARSPGRASFPQPLHRRRRV